LVIEVKHLPPCRSQVRVYEESSTPLGERSAAMLEEPLSNVAFMRDVKLKRLKKALFEEDPAETKIWVFVAEESCPLLDRICVANAHVAGHVRHRQTFDREASVHRLAADEDPRVSDSPLG